MKLATAISMSSFVVLCLTENVKDAELYLDNFKTFRSEREPTKTRVKPWRSTNCCQQTYSGFETEHQTSDVLRGSTCSIRNANYHMRIL